MSSIVEIIEFKQPDYIDNTLYVCGMKGRYDEIQLAAKLNDTFSRFGLLYNVQVHVGKLIAINEEEDDNETPIKSYYAFVKYYSHNAAVQARRIMNGRTLMDQALFIKKCDPKRSVDPNQYYLGLNRCQELANYYLGFNSWSSSITSMMQDCDDITSIDNTTNMRYICICKLKIIKYNIECEGIGIGETQYHIKDFSSKVQAIGKAKKIAYRRASENAFGKLIIIILDNGKVAIEVNNMKCDLLTSIKDAECMEGLIQVNEIEAVPAEDTMDKENSDPLEEDLDDINAQLLLELEQDY